MNVDTQTDSLDQIKCSIGTSLRRIDSILERTHDSSIYQQPTHQTTYQPWSRSNYIKRIQSFTLSSWTQRPPKIEAPTMAQHGWSMDREGQSMKKDYVVCVTCGATQYLPWMDDFCKEAELLVTEQYMGRIKKAGHLPGCPWALKPCNDAIQYLKDEDICPNTLLRVIQNFVQLDQLPDQIVGLTVSQALISRLANKFSCTTVAIDSGLLERATLLAICGWKGSVERPKLISCVFSCSSLAIQPTMTINPVKEHYWYCPMVYESSKHQQIERICSKLYDYLDPDVKTKNISNLDVLIGSFTSGQVRSFKEALQ